MMKKTTIIISVITLMSAVFLACTTNSKLVTFMTGATSAICITAIIMSFKKGDNLNA